MKIIKYPQSQLIIVGENTKILIDPGNITFKKGFKDEQFTGMDGYLITHQHADHLDPQNIKAVVSNSKVYGNADVVEKLQEFGVKAEVIKDREKFQIGEFLIEAVDLPHSPLPSGAPVPPNTGFLINEVLFHPGDSVQMRDVLVNNLALPIAGPNINFENALSLAKNMQAKVLIPIHFDAHNVDPFEFKEKYSNEFDIRVLKDGEETEV